MSRPAPSGGLAPAAPRRLAAAALVGVACGSRTWAGPLALALRGRLDGLPARVGLSLAAAGELVADKTPIVPSRTALGPLAGRVGSAAFSGRALAGLPGTAAGAAGAVAGAFGAQRARTALTELTGLPGVVVGVAEDAATYAAAALATREPGEPGSLGARLGYGAVRGAAAGLAATAAMTAAQTALQRATGSSASRTPERAVRKLLRAAFGADVPRRRRDTLNQAAHWLYGTGWGVGLGLAAAARGSRPGVPAGGAGLGLTAWGVSLLQLPALGVAPPVWEQSPGAVATDAGLHLLHGFTAAAALRALP